MSDPSIVTNIAADGRATVTLNRPDVHNAFDDELIARLAGDLEKLDQDSGVGVVILAAAGKSFSAGADLNWMKRVADFTEAENLADAEAMAQMLKTLHGLSKPTIARGPKAGSRTYASGTPIPSEATLSIIGARAGALNRPRAFSMPAQTAASEANSRYGQITRSRYCRVRPLPMRSRKACRPL